MITPEIKAKITSGIYYKTWYDTNMVGWMFLMPKVHQPPVTDSPVLRHGRERGEDLVVGPFTRRTAAQTCANATYAKHI